jgi:hypothetical protein
MKLNYTLTGTLEVKTVGDLLDAKRSLADIREIATEHGAVTSAGLDDSALQAKLNELQTTIAGALKDLPKVIELIKAAPIESIIEVQ